MHWASEYVLVVDLLVILLGYTSAWWGFRGPPVLLCPSSIVHEYMVRLPWPSSIVHECVVRLPWTSCAVHVCVVGLPWPSCVVQECVVRLPCENGSVELPPPQIFY